MDLVSDLVQIYLLDHHRELENQLMTSDSHYERKQIDNDIKCVELAIAELEPNQ